MSGPKCLRCGATMEFYLRDTLQLGHEGELGGRIFARSLDVEVYACPKCGKMEFFRPGFFREDAPEENEADELPPEAESAIVGVSREGIPQVRCPACGRKHDFDYPKCPWCDFER